MLSQKGSDCDGLLVQYISRKNADCETSDGGQRKGRGRRGEGYTGDEDDGLDALSKHGDERQGEHGILLREALEPGPAASTGVGQGALLEGGGELDTPLVLHLADAQQGGADDGDDEGGEKGEGALVVELRVLPVVDADGVKGANDGGANNQADGEAKADAEPDLAAQALVQGGIVAIGVWAAEGLLEPGKEDRDDDDGLEGLSVVWGESVLVGV